MSPGSITADQTDKPAAYAAAGIEHFWRIESSAQDERRLTAFRYRLDPTTRSYAPAGVDTDKLAVSDPVDLRISFARRRTIFWCGRLSAGRTTMAPSTISMSVHISAGSASYPAASIPVPGSSIQLGIIAVSPAGGGFG
ncbi:Uma2 family endonuclease [Saccharopolyspora sp. K220]|nr:Uma2 family endonuclease [Saccharopolyspora soli]